MAKRRNHSHIDRAAAAAASRWLERLPMASLAERREFAEWLRQSPLHVREWLLSDFIDDALSRFDSERKLPIDIPASGANIVSLNDLIIPSSSSQQHSAAQWRRWIGGVAAVLTAVAVALLYFAWDGKSQTYATGVGEQRTIALADGSLMALNVKTELKVDFSPQWRDIHLLSGQALFTVAHDSSRPFRVHVNGTMVNAVGTKFDVRRVGGRVLVYVVEGRVLIEQPQLALLTTVSPVESPRLPPVELTPGEGATIRQDGEVNSNAAIDVKAMSAWQNRRLVFEERPLTEIADEFSAYVRSPTLVVEGAELRVRLYTGSFDADRLDNFISYLERDPSLEIVRSESQVILRTAQLR